MTITRPPGLSQNAWPIHPKPLEDELLSSWMVRIARAFHIQPHVFWRLAAAPVNFRNIDSAPDAALLRQLAAKTFTSPPRIMQTTLTVFDSLGLLREDCGKRVVAFCPWCLGEGVPYYRRRWRLNFFLICDRHQSVLSDCCPKCHALIRPERVPLEMESLAFCRTCNFDLRASPVRIVPRSEAAGLQHRLFRLLNCVPAATSAGVTTAEDSGWNSLSAWHAGNGR